MALVAGACGGSGPSVIAAATSTTAVPTTAPTSVTSSTAAPTTAAPTTSPTTVAPTTVAPPTTVAAPPDLLPTLLITDGNTVRSVGPDGTGGLSSYVELVTDSPARVAHMAGDFTVVAEEHPAPSGMFGPGEVVHYLQDGTREVLPNAQTLYGIEMIGGEESAIVAQEHSVTMDSGDLVAVGLDTGTVVFLGQAWGPEYGVGTVEWSDTGIAVLSAWTDLTESVTYIDSTGGYVTRVSPTDGLAYAQAPLVQAAALSPDAQTVVWAEGPEYQTDPDTGDSVLVGDFWVVKGMNLDSGAIEFAMPIDFVGVDPANSSIDSIHWGGTFLIVNRTQSIGDNQVNLAPTLIDMTGAEPAIVPFDPAGNATPLDL